MSPLPWQPAQCQVLHVPLAAFGQQPSFLPKECHHPFTLTTGAEVAQNKSVVLWKWGTYVTDLLEMFDQLPPAYMTRPLLIRFGDCIDPLPFPALSKARQIGDANSVLLSLNDGRHFGWSGDFVDEELSLDFPFGDKVARAFWRGSTTDVGWDPSVCQPDNGRRALVERWALSSDHRIDVGLSQLAQEANQTLEFREHWQHYVKAFRPVHDQVVYRYLVSVEALLPLNVVKGNDVASGLKWMLASNSVVLMPPPKRESWLGESRLEPWVHYIPLSEDTSDLAEKMEWCEEHLLMCYSICQRATEFVRSHASRSQRFVDGAMQLKHYLDSVHIRLQYE